MCIVIRAKSAELYANFKETEIKCATELKSKGKTVSVECMAQMLSLASAIEVVHSKICAINNQCSKTLQD